MRKTTKPIALTPYTYLLIKNLRKGRDTMDDVIQRNALNFYKIAHIDIPEFKEDNDENNR